MIAPRDSRVLSGLVLIIVEVLALMLVEVKIEVNAPRKPSQDWPTGLINSLLFRA